MTKHEVPVRKLRALPRFISKFILLILIGGFASSAFPAESEAGDLTHVPIETLLNLEVYSASRYVQDVSEAPSAVSVLTAADIKTFGWRTLAEALRSLPGLYLTNNRTYTQLGARGFSHTSDVNPRFLLLIDGNRTNNPITDQAMLGSEFALDIDLIDRIEYVPGPGSSMYGSNALYGVINVITKRGRNINGWQVSGEVGSFGARKGRVSHGWKDENGAELLLSATSYHIDGKNQFYPEFVSATSDGIARKLDYDRGQSLFLKGSAGAFSFSLTHSERAKGDPTASNTQAFNAPGSKTVDEQTLASADYRTYLTANTEFYSRVFFNRYDDRRNLIYEYNPWFQQFIPMASSPLLLNREDRSSSWWGGEIKLVSSQIARHKLVAGIEYQNNDPIRQRSRIIEPQYVLLNTTNQNNRTGIYLQDDWQTFDDLILSLGLRRDYSSSTKDDTFSPRLGAIYRLSSTTTIKALYGKAFRQPNAYELYYAIPAFPGFTGLKTNPDLYPERIRSHEMVLEHKLTSDSWVRLSAYRNKISNLFAADLDSVDMMSYLKNIGRATATGLEAALEQTWPGNVRLRTSYSWQRTKSEDYPYLLNDSPHRLAKLNLSLPLPGSLWRGGIETLYVSSRPTWTDKTGGYVLNNLTLFSDRLAKNIEFSASVYNLFDKRHADPAGYGFSQESIPQDGRSLRVKLSYSF